MKTVGKSYVIDGHEKCELCGNQKGEHMVVGLFSALCKDCQDKADRVIQRYARYILGFDVAGLSDLLKRDAQSNCVDKSRSDK